MQEKSLSNRIGLLATGNELTEGDILNTNGQLIAQQLADAGFTIGMHVIASDIEADIEQGLRFLLKNHSIIIIIGGLGHTTDDRTRFALSKVLNKPLIFNKAAWEAIIKRYQKLGIEVQPHPTNQQQALFPAEAIIIPNNNGSAAGCHVIQNNKNIYLLPGPPSECLPMFKEAVLPNLLAQQNNMIKKLKWRLLGVIESDLAAKVEEAVKHYAVTTGYRIDFPYLEVKIYTDNNTPITELEQQLNMLFSEYLISATDKKASDLLKEMMIDCPYTMVIEDNATHGQLQAQLINPLNHRKLAFRKIQPSDQNNINIIISGLTEFWESYPPNGKSTLELQINFQSQEEKIKLTIPFRNPMIVKYAVEYAAKEILQFLIKAHLT